MHKSDPRMLGRGSSAIDPGHLRIAITADPELAIPCKYYGGIERVLDMLVHNLMDRGHDVTLFANPESRVPCALVPYEGLKSTSMSDTYKNMRTIRRVVRNGNYDVIHSNGRLAYLFGLAGTGIPKIMTYQRHINPRSILLGKAVFGSSVHFTAVGKHLIKGFDRFSDWRVIHNGVPSTIYTFRDTVAENAPLFFLGRIEHIKGTHLAIEIAKKTGQSLVIAGNIEPEHRGYFDTEVAPHLNETIRYIGPIDDTQKNEWIGKSSAVLMPILWDDPCPVVMAESLACGTPVIGYRRGGLPEVIEHGVTGFVCDDVSEACSAVYQIQLIRRADCRKAFEERFGEKTIVDQYENLYKTLTRSSKCL